MGLVARNSANAADFDGTNDYMATGAGLTGAADAKSGVLSCWVRVDTSPASVSRLLFGSTTVGGGVGTDRFNFSYNTAGNDHFSFIGANSAGTDILHIASSAVAIDPDGTTWYHVLSSWDLATPGARHIYINDVANLTEITFTDDTIDYTLADWSAGARTDAAQKFNGGMFDLYFKMGAYLDFSVEANRRLFIGADGKPVDLGASGTNPGLGTPEVFQHLSNGEAVANFATNRGGGGNFSITGTLETAPTSPSDQ